MKPRACELCSGEAALYCGSDSAFLCRPCDARVHQANFLAARHLRSPLCSLCRYDHSSPTSHLCTACSDAGRGSADDDGDGDDLSGSSSSCVSTTESAAGSRSEDRKRRRRVRRVEGVMGSRAREVVEAWCRRVHASGAAEVASQALGVGLRELGVGAIPIRVLAAAAVWFAAKLCCGSGAGRQRAGMAAVLGRVGACSGVPAGVVVAAERRLARAIRDCRVKEVEEGWAECS